MGEVKRYTPDGKIDPIGVLCEYADLAATESHRNELNEKLLHSCDLLIELGANYARLERERDESRRAFERAEADVQTLVRESAEAQAELTRLRAVEELAQRLVGLQYAQTGPQISEMYATLDALAEACGRKG